MHALPTVLIFLILFCRNVASSPRNNADFLVTSGGIYWCDISSTIMRDKSKSPGVSCPRLTFLTSGTEPYEKFEMKLLNAAENHSISLTQSSINQRKLPQRILARRVKLSSYILLVWAIQTFRPNDRTLWLEFGVFQGTSINITSALKKPNTGPVYGFDSFIGLPEFWENAGMAQGMFNQSGILPQVNENVQLIEGWFNETLPTFLQQHLNEKVVFVNIDNDLYNGTVDILTLLLPKFRRHSVIHFHEFYRYRHNVTGPPHFFRENDEMRALYDILRENIDLKLQFYPYRGPNKEAAVFRFINNVKIGGGG